MKPRKKNTFFTFIFSFVPGASEMYMGFMKNGLSILAIFVLPVFITGAIGGADYIAIISGIIYVYAFFHARNIATAPEDDFAAIEDKYIWDEIGNLNISGITKKTTKKWTAIALILIGACGLWNIFRDIAIKMLANFEGPIGYFLRATINSVPRLVFSVLVIVAGVLLIKEKKKELQEADDSVADE